MNENHESEIQLNQYKKKRKKQILFLVLFVVLLGIGFAYLQSVLNISGTTTLKQNTWSIYWDNQDVADGSVTDTAPSLSDHDMVATFDVTLEEPGDFYEFTIDAVNDGTLDAMIELVEKKVNNSTTIPDYLSYTVYYADDIPVLPKQILGANDSETYRVRVEFKRNIDSSILPGEDVSLSVSFKIHYIQADNTAEEVRQYLYSVNTTPLSTANPLPVNSSFDTYSGAISSFGHPVFFRHVILNNQIVFTSIGIVHNNTVYYYPANNDFYDSNYSKFTNLFVNYDFGCDVEDDGFYCSAATNDPSNVFQWGMEMSPTLNALLIAGSDMYGCLACGDLFSCGFANDEHFYDFCDFDG